MVVASGSGAPTSAWGFGLTPPDRIHLHGTDGRRPYRTKGNRCTGSDARWHERRRFRWGCHLPSQALRRDSRRPIPTRRSSRTPCPRARWPRRRRAHRRRRRRRRRDRRRRRFRKPRPPSAAILRRPRRRRARAPAQRAPRRERGRQPRRDRGARRARATAARACVIGPSRDRRRNGPRALPCLGRADRRRRRSSRPSAALRRPRGRWRGR